MHYHVAEGTHFLEIKKVYPAVYETNKDAEVVCRQLWKQNRSNGTYSRTETCWVMQCEQEH